MWVCLKLVYLPIIKHGYLEIAEIDVLKGNFGNLLLKGCIAMLDLVEASPRGFGKPPCLAGDDLGGCSISPFDQQTTHVFFDYLVKQSATWWLIPRIVSVL